MHVIHVEPSFVSTEAPHQIRGLRERGHPVRTWCHSAARLVGLTDDAVVVVDGRDDTEAAARYCRELALFEIRAPVVVAVRSDGLGAIGGRWPVDDFVLSRASLVEWESRLLFSLQRRKRSRSGSIQRLGELVLDGDAYTVQTPGATVALTGTEYRVLRLFFDSPGAVLSRSAIRAQGWGEGAPVGRSIDTFVCRLRRKLGPAGKSLETVRGVGYRLVPGPRAAASERAA